MEVQKIYSYSQNKPIFKAAQPGAVVTNPVQNTAAAENAPAKTQELPAATPFYNATVPLKYTDLGTQHLPCSITAHMYKLENGQRVVIVPKKGPTVVKTYVNVGSMNEPDRVRGISHFIEHNLFNGSQGLDAGEFFATVNKLGANTNASTSFANTDYYIESNLLKKNDLETEIKIHASMLETPKFAQNMIEKEKGPVTSEINMILDDPENVATNNTLKLLFNIHSTSKDVIGGTVDNINKLTREDVVDYYQRNYYPSNMTTVITGEVDPQEAISLISKNFHSRAQAPKTRNYEQFTPIQKSVRSDLTSDKTNAAIVSLGFAGPQNTNTKDKILLDAFQFFLVGSSVARLNKSLEEIQTNAFVTSDRIGNKPSDNMVVLFSTQVSDENSQNAINKVFKEIADLEKHPPTDEELAIVKKKLKLNLAQVFESSSTINTVIGTSMLDNDIQSVTEFEKVIDNLSAQDMVDFAKKYFDTNKVAITVVHPAKQSTGSAAPAAAQGLSFKGAPDEINHKEAIDTTKVKKYVASNNFAIVTNDIDKNLATFDLSLSTSAPGNVKPGVSEILSLMLNRGSEFKGEKDFFMELEHKGIQANFDANNSEIHVNSMFLPADAQGAMKSVKEVILNPRFTQEDLESAKQFLKESLQNSPKSAQEGLLREMFKGQFYGTTDADVLNNIDNITLTDIQSLYHYILKNSQGRIVVSGPFSQNPQLQTTIFNEVCTGFPVLKPAKPSIFNSYMPVPTKKVVIAEHNKTQAEIQMGYKFKTNGNLKDAVTVELMNTILGGTPSSRLFSDLREKQKLAYQVNSKLGTFDNSGVLAMFIKTTTDDPQTGANSYDNVKKSIEGFKAHVSRMMSENVTDEELESAKLTLKNKILNNSELTADKNLEIFDGLRSYYGTSINNQVLDTIDKITADDLRAAANYIFKSNPTISVVATKKTLDNNMDYLKAQGTVV